MPWRTSTPTSPRRWRYGDIIVAGRNFGCGSSREQAPVALKSAGVGAVVAGSFARIFYRNAINIGLPVIECPEAYDVFKNGDVALINIEKGIIVNETHGQEHQVRNRAGFPAGHNEERRSGSLHEEKLRNR